MDKLWLKEQESKLAMAHSEITYLRARVANLERALTDCSNGAVQEALLEIARGDY